MRHPMRVYADSSVFGGVFDEEFENASRRFFDIVRGGRFQLVVSVVLRDELEGAPERVKSFFQEMCRGAEIADPNEDAVLMQRAYLDAGIVGAKWGADALHVALATISDCRLIVSWNFKHIVHYRKIPMYNGINAARGYAPIAIHTPSEVVDDEDED